MTDEQLMYAAMLALTRQNQAFKLAPNSTARMYGTVIDRNVLPGDTVVVYYNDSGELTRVGDVPVHSGNYFIDDHNKMYFVQNNRLHIIDGLSGDLIRDDIEAYGWRVVNGGVCAAFQTQERDGTYLDDCLWRVIYPDGSMSREIEIPDQTSSRRKFALGFRNGILAVVTYAGTDEYAFGLKAYTYTPDGDRITELSPINAQRAVPQVIAPINRGAVGVAYYAGARFWDITYYRYGLMTTDFSSGIDPWAGYDTSGPGSYSQEFIGADQSSIYTTARIYTQVEISPEVYEWEYTNALARFDIDSFTELEIMEERALEFTVFVPQTPLGSVVRSQTVINPDTREEETVVELVDIATLEPLYSNEPITLTAEANTIHENEGWIWIDGSGVYQKTQLGWLMYPSATYPRNVPWGKLGYAMGKYKIGDTGAAILLFE